jgi:hypothetical protein
MNKWMIVLDKVVYLNKVISHRIVFAVYSNGRIFLGHTIETVLDYCMILCRKSN